MKSPATLSPLERSLPNCCLAEASTRNVALFTAFTETPTGHGILYSKKPEPAPFTFIPSIADQVLRDHFASLYAAASTRDTMARLPSLNFTSREGSASTTNVMKLRPSTAP